MDHSDEVRKVDKFRSGQRDYDKAKASEIEIEKRQRTFDNDLAKTIEKEKQKK
jgi:hypothetical protein